MAAIDTNVKADFLFKKLLNLSRTSSQKDWYGESIYGGVLLDSKRLWTSIVPVPPPGNSTTIVEKYGIGIATPGFALTKDITVGDSKCWLAQSDGAMLTDWIPPYYHPEYVVHIYKSNEDEIPTTSSSNWLFDYQAGVLTFEGDCPDTNHIYLRGYRYVGGRGVSSGIIVDNIAISRGDNEIEIDTTKIDIQSSSDYIVLFDGNTTGVSYTKSESPANKFILNSLIPQSINIIIVKTTGGLTNNTPSNVT